MFRKAVTWLALAGLVLSFASSRVGAAGLEVHPISIVLTDKQPSDMIAITNRNTEPVRFHIRASSWAQRPDGSMILEPTQDLVFFPAMMTLNPQEARNLRVGVKVKPGAVEKTYRIFVQELPPILRSDGNVKAVGLMTQMALPVFLQPDKPKPAPSIVGLTLNRTEVRFSLKNSGNVHVMPDDVVLVAKDGDKVVHKEDLHAWYVLAGGVREYVVTLPTTVCLTVKSLEVEVKTDQGPIRATLGNVHCTP